MSRTADGDADGGLGTPPIGNNAAGAAAARVSCGVAGSAAASAVRSEGLLVLSLAVASSAAYLARRSAMGERRAVKLLLRLHLRSGDNRPEG
jgi:hypothetical protein